jgi:hypothetical protein
MKGTHMIALQSLVQMVAYKLGVGWSWVEPSTSDRMWKEYPNEHGKIAGPEGASLDISYDSRKKRLHISGNWPRDEKGNLYPSRERPDSIYCGSEREPVAIGKDILRRYLPAYMETYKRGLELLKQHQNFESGKTALLAKVAEVIGVTPSNHRENHLHYYPSGGEGGYFEVRVDAPDSVEIHIRSLPADKAIKVCKLLVIS